MRNTNSRSRGLKLVTAALLAGVLGTPLAADAAPLWKVSLAPSADGLPLRAAPPTLKPRTSSLLQRLSGVDASDTARLVSRGDFAEYNLSAARPRIYTRQGLEAFGHSDALLADSLHRGSWHDSTRLDPPSRFYQGPRASRPRPVRSQEPSKFELRTNGVGTNLSYGFR